MNTHHLDEREAFGPKTALVLRNVSKSFGSFKALRNVDFTLAYGEVHALMGENGAGKSTLMKVLSGAYQPDSGSEIIVNGRSVVVDTPLRAAGLGVAVIYQELSLSPNLTVAENIFLGREPRHGMLVDRRTMEKGAREALRQLGSRIPPSALVGQLSLADRQMVEIARAISTKARIIVMDEPTTMLSSQETDGLFRVIRELRGLGYAIVYISHRMEEIYDLSDRCTVLRDGACVGTLERAELNAGTLVRMMVGRPLESFYHKQHGVKKRETVLLDVREVTDGKRIKPSSFQLYAGEVLGIAGLVGAGRTELMRMVSGVDPVVSGSIWLEGRPVRIENPRAAIEAGILYLTEDRKQQGVLLDMSISENVNLIVCRRDAAPGGFLNKGRARSRALAAMARLKIKAQHQSAPVRPLSGGNQQKVLLSRLLEAEPKVLILDEPTRGIDIGAKTDIYDLIDRLAAQGVGIIIVSSELPELLGIADRTIVLREGSVQGEVGGEGHPPATQESIMHLATASRTQTAYSVF